MEPCPSGIALTVSQRGCWENRTSRPVKALKLAPRVLTKNTWRHHSRQAILEGKRGETEAPKSTPY